ncbi:hypothetical protein GCM10010392_65060 [Streptomyces clavifer]|nr:hypothetical protein GCM10010392_65060 [Streptomyces clavifer]
MAVFGALISAPAGFGHGLRTSLALTATVATLTATWLEFVAGSVPERRETNVGALTGETEQDLGGSPSRATVPTARPLPSQGPPTERRRNLW